MKILEVPPTISLTLGQDQNGAGGRTFEYSFAAWLREAIISPTSGFGAWDKTEVGVELLRAVRVGAKPGAVEIVLEDAWYDALLVAVKAFQMNPEAAIQVSEGGYRKAVEKPKQGKASE